MQQHVEDGRSDAGLPVARTRGTGYRRTGRSDSGERSSMIGRWPLPGWPDGFPGRVPIVSDVTAALGIDPLVMLLRSTALVAMSTLRDRESTVTAGAVRIRGILEELTVGQDPQGV